MGKQEFIDELRNSLDKEVPAAVIEENVRYYSGYIDEQLSKGKTMEDIESEIGRGSVVARSIIEAEEHKKNKATYKDNYSQKNFKAKNYNFNVNTWYGKLLGILLLILVVIIVIAIIGILVALAWYVVIPVLALGAIVYIIVKLVTGIKG